MAAGAIRGTTGCARIPPPLRMLPVAVCSGSADKLGVRAVSVARATHTAPTRVPQESTPIYTRLFRATGSLAVDVPVEPGQY